MPRPPPIAAAPQFPMTSLLCGGALVVSISQMLGRGIEPLVMDERAFWAQPWRLLTSALPHGSPAHLIFNLLWCWILGTHAEHFLGRWRVGVLIILSAAGSAAAEFALYRGGIGLSGIVYALFGTLWVMSRIVPSLRGLMTRNTALLFLVWFVLCILTTWMGWMNVANYAHAAGLGIGVLLGFAYAAKDWRRWAGWLGAVGLSISAILAAWVWRPYVNLRWTDALIERAQPFLDQGQDALALPMLRAAWERDPADIALAFNTALLSFRTGDVPGAIRVLARWSADGRGGNEMSGLAIALAGQTLATYPWDALVIAGYAVAFDPANADAWDVLSAARFAVGDVTGAIDAAESGLSADPSLGGLRERVQWIRTVGYRQWADKEDGHG